MQIETIQHSSGAKASHNSSTQGALWQHPYVDVFKYFKLLPQGDWRQNKKQGDVEEIFAKEIGRKALAIQGSISANNFVQLPHPTSLLKALNLTGRYIYIELKSPKGGPFSLHFDFGMAERAHGVRISLSNLFKGGFSQANGFVIQAPLDLATDKWTVVCVDIVELLDKSRLFPPSYNLEGGAHSLKSMTLCANIQLRGVYTSDNEYNIVTLPSDMKFKFSFEARKWAEHFDWKCIPGDYGQVKGGQGSNFDGIKQKSEKREEERQKMQGEINALLSRQPKQAQDTDEDLLAMHNQSKRSRIGKLPEYGEDHENNQNQFNMEERRDLSKKQNVNLGALKTQGNEYSSGMYCGTEFKRSPKLNQDPVIELRHIIGYSPDRCLNLKWSRFPNDPNVVIFTSGGTLIAMDIEANQQKRFFFGHSAPICCFDVNANGALIASAQEGKNSIIRVWEYTSGRCISMMTMPVTTLKCVAFSYDGKYLASVGKDERNKELIIVWDITRIGQPGGGKPEIVAKQTSDFNILHLRFSPIDSSRMASCGKENIRFWRIKDNGSIRGSAVVLNHHARNTIFTCLDFEYGLRAVDPKENESLKRLFVGSKHGMVFQVNYHTESLEATYQTNDSAIYGISVNEAFCVTGSEDTYLRVWPLDFSEFFMEAKHEGTVGAVEISPDGLKVVCGTLNGSLGVLDKSNQKYRTFLRSHTDQVLSMDYHLGKRIVITVSKDKTIRLWDLVTSDQVYEFSSPVDQALCVAAHPSLPLFSCGFESGVMRVFDIERTCVADEFCQFNKPLVKIAYSPQGDLLVSCCVDGGVAIHNPRRQHLPIKMLHLELPPEFVHVAFTQILQSLATGSHDFVSDFSGGEIAQFVAGDQSQQTSRFAVMGDCGNNVNIYDSTSFIVAHQIHAAQQLKQFTFSNNNRELIVMTSDCRLRFYSLARYEGIILRELSAVHRGSITSMSVSNNSGYFLTGGEDSMLKAWDYEANKTSPYYFQAFIGHTYPVRAVMFCPSDNTTIMSVGDKDGIYLWNFYGDVQTQFAHPPALIENESEHTAEHRRSKSGSVLERLRNNKKEQKMQHVTAMGQLKEGSFVLPPFRQMTVAPEPSGTSSTSAFDDNGDDSSAMLQQIQQYTQTKREKGLTYNHYASIGPNVNVDLTQAEGGQVMEPSVLNGFDGFGGVHDNVVWSQADGWMAYTLHNKVVFESVKTREQTILCDSNSHLSTLAISTDKRFIAAGEGRPTQKSGNSLIYLYDTQTRKLIAKYTFHQRGVQALAFSNNAQHLISVGVQGENNIAIWDLSSGLVVKSCLIKNTQAINQLKVDPYVSGEGDYIQFAAVGNKGAFNIYRYEVSAQMLQQYEVDNVPTDYKNCDFTSLTYTQFLNAQGQYYAVIGCADGSMAAYDLLLNHFIEEGEKRWVITGEIGHAKASNQTIVIASSSGTIARFAVQTHSQFFPAEAKQVQILRAEGAVVSLALDDLNNEGIVGTSLGVLYYFNFAEKLIIRIVSKAYGVQRAITSVKFCETNPQLILSNVCNNTETSGSPLCKVWTSATLDQVMKFSCSNSIEGSGPVAFALSGTNGSKFSVIAHQGGLLRMVNIESLRVEGSIRLPIHAEDEVLTSGTVNPNGVNIAIGTNLGNIYFGSIKEDSQGRPKAAFGRLDVHGSSYVQTVTSLQFSQFDPIGSFLASFDNGVVKTWQSSVRNEQFLKLLELQQQQQSVNLPMFDMSESGFQQYDLQDVFDMFENPHGLDEVNENERSKLRLLYQNKRHRQCEARFSPSRSSVDLYFSYVGSLQFIYVRNFISQAIVKRVSLMHFPTCFALTDFNNLGVDSEDHQGGEQVLAVVGTKEGRLLSYKITSAGNTKLAETRAGLTYGAISSIDLNVVVDRVVAATESGELFTAGITSSISNQE